ncbi:hydrolase [Vibrio sp. UCD-FRSSP16_10]|uniref:hydrolase n=1 Tax=unclassified Vibrio TaxID=2614977 RepID=UPI0007FDAACB|nr:MULTISPECIES: hydrolase [unclassified Vibrio]OBT10055.1 hydrolase [Vibrio sp. UCD-FRSSP16_30]OBT18845.1 hydrolase [Vibrio sp. UCD-FRSSP16_10]
MNNSFSPHWGIRNPHLQTLMPRLIRRQPLFTPVWETLHTTDDDFLDLAWSEDWQNAQTHNKPIFILFHGLEGSFNSTYANGLMHAFANKGWLSVMMHFRGCSGKPNKQARAYHSGETEDARFFLEHIHKRYPNNPKVAVGVSLGGNMLVNYLANYTEQPLVDEATVICAPLDLAACSKRIEQGFSKLYQSYLLNSLKKHTLQKMHLLEDVITINSTTLNNMRFLHQFDDAITAPLHGYVDAKDYYTQCSGLPRLNDIRIPTNIIHAKDDPFMTDEVIPTFTLNNNLQYHLMNHGGHVGFVAGSLKAPNFWLEMALPNFYDKFTR